MKLEKRTAASDTPAVETPATPAAPAGKSKPVMIYIVVLFCAAFLLIAYSILMQQHSQGETLGQLQNSVTAMQEVQDLQEKIISLQDQLSEKDDALEDRDAEISRLQQDAAADSAAAAQQEKVTRALLGLYTLQQQFLVKDLDGCRETMKTMEDEDLISSLPDKAMGLATAPSTRYQQLAEVIASL